jgi:O-antigen/teichoic acid export membrane protein
VLAYLKRLVSSLGAYQLADLVSKVMAILLLPVYTGYIAPSGYGVVETLATAVIFVSIVVRFGMIESFLRYYFADDERPRQDALARRTVIFLVCTSTVAAVVLAIPAGPLSRLVLSHAHPADYRVAVLGLWAFTNLELAYALLRVDERLRAYAVASLSNVAITIVASVILVVVAHLGAEGLLIGNYGATAVVLVGLWWAMRDRLWTAAPSGGGPAVDSFRVLFAFGLPTVPAEASVYALSVVDRQYLVHDRGLAAAGLYSLAVKIAGAVAFVVRAFQYAWPPLAYSIAGDLEASRLYGLVTTYYVVLCGWIVAGLTLEARAIVGFLAPHDNGYGGAFRAVPWVSLGWAMYGLWVVFLVIAGRAKLTRRNFPAAIAGLLVNVVLVVLLVPRYGIAGAGVALCGAYVAMLAVMHTLLRRAFPVQFEWRRIAHVVLVAGGIAAAGDLLLPATGLVAFLTRAAAFAAIPPALLVTGFPHHAELVQARALVRRARGPRLSAP